MAFFDRAIDDLTKDDVESLVNAQVVEDSTIEFKREVEIDASGRVRDASRNDVARELVAFANADGGTLIIGVEESEEDPKRAKSIKSLPNCHDLAERLRRAVFEIIEPKLPMLQARAIDTEANGGVIVFVVPHSRRAPHRVESLRDCYRRLGSESRKMTMREIQELTLSVAAEANILERRFLELEDNFAIMLPRLQPRMKSETAVNFCEIRFSAIPLSTLWLGRVIGRHELAPAMATIKFDLFNQPTAINYPWGGSRALVALSSAENDV